MAVRIGVFELFNFIQFPSLTAPKGPSFGGMRHWRREWSYESCLLEEGTKAVEDSRIP